MPHLLLTLNLLFLPHILWAQEEEYQLLAPFPGAPDASDTAGYFEALYNFLIISVGIAALLMIVVGGIWYVSSAGNQARMGTAKTIITDALLGLAVVFLAWLILNTINPDLVKGNLSRLAGDFENGEVDTGSGTNPGNCSNCVEPSGRYAIKDNGTAVCSADTCLINDELDAYLGDFGSSSPGNELHATELFPPTVPHSNTCHYDGTCLDMSFINKNLETPIEGDPAAEQNRQRQLALKIFNLINSGKQNNLRLVYEVSSQEEVTNLLSQGIVGLTPGDIIPVPGVKPHFSVYLN